MNTFEICCGIRRVILNSTAEVMNYPSWGSEYAYKQITQLAERIKGNRTFKFIDPTALTLSEMQELGFGKWEEGSKLMLIPLWLMQFIDPELEVTCISGEVCQFKDADNDNRYGCLAYGIFPKE
ncbi:hypothetical protein GAP32_352 [Cronobacter phage vB_CsaM_GAP32]|uniref:Uncharacterized protein n=1 Tax=Cronobacter phage vB_CsaM_GAP32 TaxID=1141136 RepID=K4F7M3_9CAUD|nr:hypothetical protein GAP32_352 [Cronobacter phage vB_CsaM_GAP32]AFC21802.1 hypothetical protein GAP32_352 [Cronobacter phage vB_CsaM_GAP32]